MDFDEMISLIRAIDLRLSLTEADKRPADVPPARRRTRAPRDADPPQGARARPRPA